MTTGYEEIGNGPEPGQQQQGWVTVDHPTGTGVGTGPPGEVSAKSVAEHLSSLLLSADASARRIVEEAEARARDHLAEIDRRSRWVEAEAARLASWSRQTEKLIQTMSTAFADFRKDVESIPRQVNEALAPLASHVTVIVRQIDQLTGALGTQVPERPPAPVHPAPEGAAYPAAMPFEPGAGDGSGQPGHVTSWDDLSGGTPSPAP